MTQPVIQTENLTFYYGRQRGIEDVTLEIRPGEVFGFLGPNGAGKTTTQRALLDVLRPQRGRATLFGLDSRKEGVAIRKRVGYLPGELSLPKTLTARQFLESMARIRGVTDRRTLYDLCERLELDPSRRLRQYSRGNKQKVGLVAAMLHRPELLILDEPTSGLDPLVQQTVLELVRAARSEGRTVFFSSHVLSEVQAVCDRVGIIRAGQLVAVERVDTLVKQQFRRLHLTLDRLPPTDAFEKLAGVRALARQEKRISLEIRQNLTGAMQAALQYGLLDIEEQPVTLEDIFLAYYGNHGGKENGDA